MKKRKFLTLLMIGVTLCSLLAGCGNTNEEVVENEILQTITSEQETPEPTVEVSSELENAKEEILPEETVISMEFGKIVRLGANEDYPEVLEDLEIYFNGQTFQVSLPKDMCAEFEWDIEKKILKIFDENKTKIYFLSFSQNPMPYTDTKTYTSTEDMNNLLNSWGYTTIDGATVVDLENNEIALSQRIPVGLENYMGEFMYYQVYSNEPYETTNQNNEVVKVEDVTQFIIFYGDATKTNVDEISAYIMESFMPITDENSYIGNVDNVLNQSNKINADISSKYCIPENLTLPTTATLRDVNGRVDIAIPLTSENETFDFLMDLNNVAPIKDEKEELKDTLNTSEITKENLMEYFSKRQSLALSYEYNGTKCRINMSKSDEKFNITIIKL